MSTEKSISIIDLTAQAFAPFGDIICTDGDADMIINQGLCGRYHDRANLDFVGGQARAGISLFESECRTLPYLLDMMERHPLGTQAFIPMSEEPFLVIVAPDDNGSPGKPIAFLAPTGHGVNYHKNIWHGVLTPLSGSGRFCVIDRIGEGNNLEEHWFDQPWLIEEPRPAN